MTGAPHADSLKRAGRNRDYWDSHSESYIADHPEHISFEKHPSWGAWHIPDRDIRVFSEVEGARILEIGCGDAHDLIALARRRARVVGADISEVQLARAADLARFAETPIELVQADAERLPFADASFDFLFSDYGATDFAEPSCVFGEVSRVLRPGGIFALCTLSPWVWACMDERGQVTERLVNTYFRADRFVTREVEWFVLGYARLIELARSTGFSVERLIELVPPTETENLNHPLTEWARRWPADHLWVLRRTP